jgi:hypothetical protein
MASTLLYVIRVPRQTDTLYYGVFKSKERAKGWIKARAANLPAATTIEAVEPLDNFDLFEVTMADPQL